MLALRRSLDFLQHGAWPEVLGAAVLLGALAACGRGIHHAGNVLERSVVQVAIPRDPAMLNPLISETEDEFSIEAAIFDGLLKFDSNGRLIPDLAVAVPSRTNGGISADFSTITYHLRRSVVWQDGSPFTSGDVAFTYRMLISDRVASPLRSSYEQIASLEAPSPFIVVVQLRKPSLAAISQIFVAGEGFIVPEHVLRHVDDIHRALFNASPVGTGPFSVYRWKRGDDIQLVANDRYFGGRPRVRGLRLRIVPDADTRSQLVATGAVDLAAVAPGAVSSLASVPGIRIVQGRTTDVFYLDLNTRRAPLDDRAVRDALASAIDREQVVSALAGRAQIANSLMPHVFRFPCIGDRRPHALLERPGGKLHLEITYAAAARMDGVALALQQMWKSIGVDATLRALPFALLYGERGVVATGRYEVAIDGLGVATPGDIAPIIGTNNAPPNGFNFSRYANANVDRWLAMADATDDERERARLYAHVQDTLCRDAPVIPLFWRKYTYAFSSRLHGFAPEPITSDLWNVAVWSLQ